MTSWDLRPLACSVLRRAEDPVRAPGSSLRSLDLRERAVGVRAPQLKRPARPEPNAPLLMRIVRRPYVLAPAPVQRITVIEPAPGAPGREPSPRPGRPFAALLQDLGARVRPALSPRPRPQWVPPPFERRRDP